MITCTLGEKKYTVDFVSGRALREMEPASKMYGRLVRLSQDATEGKDVSQEQLTVTDALDTMVKWFCILFNNQFTPDEVYDNYPADRLMHDIALALMATQTQTTEVLDTFPTIPAVQEAEQILAEAGGESGSDDPAGSLTLPEYIYATYNELMKNGWRMKEIDEMDMLGFLRLRAWDATREQEKKKPRQRFIDEVWPGMKPG